MLVEFFGLPGSGKSTLSNMVAALLVQRGVTAREATHALNNRTGKVSRAARKAGHIARYVLARPRAAFRTTLQIYRTRQQSLGDVVRICCNSLFVHSVATRCEHADAVVLMDEGATQALWSIGLGAQSQGWLDLVLRDEMLTRRPDMVVFVQADEQTIKRRLAGRREKVSRLQDMLDSGTLGQQVSMSKSIAEIMRARHLDVVQVNNDNIDRLDLNARVVVSEILAKRISIAAS
jgi:thymidylate kinase